MRMNPKEYVDSVLFEVRKRDTDQTEFHQSVHELFDCIVSVGILKPKYQDARILERMVEPERVIIFRVPWVDDSNEIHVERGFRVQMNSAVGPYKGGLRTHPSVNLSVLKSLAFEQTFRNALTTLSIGGAMGGSDFDANEKSDIEIMSFCQSFSTELNRHVEANTDIVDGDIGVEGREIGFLFGQYKRCTGRFYGTFTGRGLNWGGAEIRVKAAGFSVVYFADEMVKARRDDLAGKTVCAKIGAS